MRATSAQKAEIARLQDGQHRRADRSSCTDDGYIWRAESLHGLNRVSSREWLLSTRANPPFYHTRD